MHRDWVESKMEKCGQLVQDGVSPGPALLKREITLASWQLSASKNAYSRSHSHPVAVAGY